MVAPAKQRHRRCEVPPRDIRFVALCLSDARHMRRRPAVNDRWEVAGRAAIGVRTLQVKTGVASILCRSYAPDAAPVVERTRLRHPLPIERLSGQGESTWLPLHKGLDWYLA